MSLNKYMHPRNPYRVRKPDFKSLAIKHDFFRQYITTTLTGKCILDFKKPEALRALLCALLKEDFGIELDIPVSRLIPTLPLRINYLLWIQDLLSVLKPGLPSSSFLGIDVGTGASCIYSLLGSKFCGWDFLALEVDNLNYKVAVKNVSSNQLANNVRVVRLSEDETFHDVVTRSVSPEDTRVLFCMCNPPFFTDACDMQAVFSTRKDQRPQPWSVSSAAEVESITTGGEVGFIQRIVQSSLILRDKLSLYTTMLGKKSSLSPLKILLQSHGITNVGTYEFCQGRTMRWGLAWVVPQKQASDQPVSASLKFQFPISPFQVEKKISKPLKFVVPKKTEVEYKLSLVTWRLKMYLDEIGVSHQEVSSESTNVVNFRIVSYEKSWTNQRRKRREKLREMKRMKLKRAAEGMDQDQAMEAVGGGLVISGTKRQKVDDEDEGFVAGDDVEATEVSMEKSVSDVDSLSPASLVSSFGNSPKAQEDHAKVEAILEDGSGFELEEIEDSQDIAGTSDSKDEGRSKSPVLDCNVFISQPNQNLIEIELSWEPGRDREMLHQVLQFFKNRFNQ